MTFGPDHYVPVLKTKVGEKGALRLIAKSVQARITPLLEIPERKALKGQQPKELDKHIQTAFTNLDVAVAPFSRFFLDCREIALDGAAAAVDVFQRAAALQTPFTPVTGISRVADVQAALTHGKHGVAIRLTRAEYEAGRLAGDLPRFMRTHGLKHAETDLILDLGPVDNMISPGVEALGRGFVDDVPAPEQWRTLTVSGCAFPQSMAVVEGRSHALIDRVEWQAWRLGLYGNRANLARLPTFSDCAIQHPSGVEGFDPRIMSASASTRIATGERWLLIKGVSTKSVPAPKQFPGLATQLVYGHLQKPHWAGDRHCAGCQGMKLCADGAPKVGTPLVWRRLGTVHHLTCVTEQLRGLTWP
jgi:hypothetical protein